MSWQTNVDARLKSLLRRGKLAEFISELLDSNPVVAGRIERLTEYHDQPPAPGQPHGVARLRRVLEAEAQRGLSDALSFSDGDMDLIVEGVKRRVTQFLMLKHHYHLVSESAAGNPGADNLMAVGFIWFPASYLAQYRYGWKVFGAGSWYEGYCHEEFYGAGGGQRHPAVVIEVGDGGRTGVCIPISHRAAADSLKFALINAVDGRERYAVYSHPFVAGWVMITEDTEDFRGHSIAAGDLDRIRRKYFAFKAVESQFE